jgi:toxin ParE1/3/4
VKVRLTERALADLKAIARWIGSDNPERADSFSAELRRACLGLGNHSLSFPVADWIGGREIRKRVYGRYVIFYRVQTNDVEVLRVVHGARNWAALLKDGD